MISDLTCDACRSLLLWYAVGQLDINERAAVTHHLETCGDCNAELARWHEVAATLSQTESQIPIDNEADATWEHIADNLPLQTSLRESQLRGVTEMSFESNTSAIAERHVAPPIPAGGKVRRWVAVAVTLVAIIVGVTTFATLHAHQPQSLNLSLPPGPQVSLNSSWQINAGAVTSSNDAWGVGEIVKAGANIHDGNAYWLGARGLILHYTDNAWKAISITLPNTVLWQIAMVSATDGWIVGQTNIHATTEDCNYCISDPILLHYHNGTWNKVAVPMVGGVLEEIQMASATDGLAFGYTLSGTPTYLRFHNGTWQEFSFPDPDVFHNGPYALDSSGDIWTYDGLSQLNRYKDGKVTTVLTLDPNSHQAINGVYVAAANDVWVNTGSTLGGNEYLLHYNGTSWQRVDFASGTIPSGYFGQTFINNSDWLGVITYQGGVNDYPAYLIHLVNGQWTLTSPKFSIKGILDISPTESWAIGIASSANQQRLGIFHYHNGDWSALT